MDVTEYENIIQDEKQIQIPGAVQFFIFFFLTDMWLRLGSHRTQWTPEGREFKSTDLPLLGPWEGP